ncbi:hypothetical protein WJX73_008457 [Symbiochloris irregularis]|uniref:Uncharacterized protein n=1 Tax=Symbiochloris irregularis TaxID=706552 RepID=A0AAW1NV51_9CHLO
MPGRSPVEAAPIEQRQAPDLQSSVAHSMEVSIGIRESVNQEGILEKDAYPPQTVPSTSAECCSSLTARQGCGS